MSGATGGRPSTTTRRRRSAPTSGASRGRQPCLWNWPADTVRATGVRTRPVRTRTGRPAHRTQAALRRRVPARRGAQPGSGDHGAAGGVAAGALWEVRVSRRRLWDSPRPLGVRRRDDGVSGPHLACHRRRSSQHRLTPGLSWSPEDGPSRPAPGSAGGYAVSSGVPSRFRPVGHAELSQHRLSASRVSTSRSRARSPSGPAVRVERLGMSRPSSRRERVAVMSRIGRASRRSMFGDLAALHHTTSSGRRRVAVSHSAAASARLRSADMASRAARAPTPCQHVVGVVRASSTSCRWVRWKRYRHALLRVTPSGDVR
ncbi:UNVERIFIED_CONTAM: hypothetical protein RKD50_009207 [Streptomyces canus]